MEGSNIPTSGNWPVDPQQDMDITKDRIWVDGCFDFAHHGHAGAMLQARKLGSELVVGIHSDEEILHNKGPTVMALRERVSAVEACRWATKAVPCAPYVTSLPWVSHYGCHYVVHGDDVSSDSGGEDCYRYVKAAGRFLVVKRTPGISTTDLVGRMLLCTKSHFIKSLARKLAGEEGSGSPEERKTLGKAMSQSLRDYATDESGLKPGPKVFNWIGSETAIKNDGAPGPGTFQLMVDGKGPQPGQRIIYVDGGFDLFSSGHIEFIRQVVKAEEEIGRCNGWYSGVQRHYGPAYLVAGVHDDEIINHWKGVNYPIMNIFERGLCVLQCRYINSVVFSAPFAPAKVYLTNFPLGTPHAVYHGPTAFMPLTYDPYTDAKALGIYKEIGNHDFQNVNAGEIVHRIMRSRKMYEERQRVKGEKAITEDAVLRREAVEREAAELQRKSTK